MASGGCDTGGTIIMLHLFRKWSEVQILYRKNVALENNSLSAEQITGVENRKSKAGEAVLPVLRSVSLFLLGLLGVLLILLTLLVIAAEAARIICLGPAAKKQQKERPGRRIRRTEARIYQYLCQA